MAMSWLERRESLAIRVALFLLWFIGFAFLTSQHVFWRDEIRALSYALQGDDPLEMWRLLRGDGHPALWYLMLRGAHALFGTPLVLPGLAAAIAIALAAILAFRSGLAWPWLALILFGKFILYEYGVMARNYGISVLLLAALAAAYARGRGCLLQGVLLFLLVNTNVHAAILAFAFLLFVACEAALQEGASPGPHWRRAVALSAFAFAGAVCCLLTLFPVANDAATVDPMVNAYRIARAVLVPALLVPDLFPGALEGPLRTPMAIAASVLMFGATLILARSLPALAAGLASLLGLSLFFQFVYPGQYRHAGLWLAFLVMLYWLASVAHKQDRENDGRAIEERAWTRVAGRIGAASLAFLLGFQVWSGGKELSLAYRGIPESRSRDLARLVDQTPAYRESWIVADPDYLLDPLPYYLTNPTYFIRERRPGKMVKFTMKARLELSLRDILEAAEELRRQSGHPVLILLSTRLEPATEGTAKVGYNWLLHTPNDEVERFLRSTRRIVRFAPARTDESYDVYALD